MYELDRILDLISQDMTILLMVISLIIAASVVDFPSRFAGDGDHHLACYDTFCRAMPGSFSSSTTCTDGMAHADTTHTADGEILTRNGLHHRPVAKVTESCSSSFYAPGRTQSAPVNFRPHLC
jgi:hypothetical protein